MNYRFLKFLELENEEITVIKIKDKTFCSQNEAETIYKHLLDEKVIDNNKVVDSKNFKRLAQHRFFYDTYHELNTSLNDIIKFVLLKDERFIKIISQSLNIHYHSPTYELWLKTFETLNDENIFLIQRKAISFLNSLYHFSCHP